MSRIESEEEENWCLGKNGVVNFQGQCMADHHNPSFSCELQRFCGKGPSLSLVVQLQQLTKQLQHHVKLEEVVLNVHLLVYHLLREDSTIIATSNV